MNGVDAGTPICTTGTVPSGGTRGAGGRSDTTAGVSTRVMTGVAGTGMAGTETTSSRGMVTGVAGTETTSGTDAANLRVVVDDLMRCQLGGSARFNVRPPSVGQPKR